MFLVSFGNIETGEMLKLKTELGEEIEFVGDFAEQKYYASKEKVLELWFLLQQAQFDKLRQETWLPMDERLGRPMRIVSRLGWNKLIKHQKRLKAT